MTSVERPTDVTRASHTVTPADETTSRSSLSAGAVQLVNLCLRHARLILAMGAVAAVTAGMLSMMRARTWTSMASFTPQTSTPDRAGVASLAASFGISVSGNTTAESPQFYSDVLNSNEILRRVAVKSYRVAGGSMPLPQILKTDQPDTNRQLFETVKELREMVNVTTNLRTGIVTLTVTSKSPELSQQLADSLTATVNAFNLESRQSRAGSEREFTEAQLAKYQRDLGEAETEYEAFLRGNRQISLSPSLQLESDRLQRRIAMLQSLVTSLTQAYEQARIDEVRRTPAIRMIERPRIPAEPNARGTIRIALLAGIAGTLLGLLVAVTRERLGYARRQGDPDIEELLRASRDLLPRGLGRRA